MSIDDRLRAALQQEAEGADPRTEAMLHRVASQGLRKAQSRRRLTLAFSMAAAIVLLTVSPFLVRMFEGPSIRPAGRLVAPSEDLVTTDLAVGMGAAWALTPYEGGIEIVSVAPDGQVRSNVARLTEQVFDIAAGGGFLWVTTKDAVTKLSPEGALIERFDLPGARRIAFNTNIYVSSDDGTLTELEPSTGDVLTRFRACSGAGDIIFAGVSLWLNCDPPLARVELATEEVTRRFPNLIALAGEDSGVWVQSLSSQGTMKLDPVSGEILLRNPSVDPAGIAVGEDSVWIVEYEQNGGSQIVPLDPRTGRQAGQPITLPDDIRLPVVAAEGRIWFRDSTRGVFSFPDSSQVLTSP